MSVTQRKRLMDEFVICRLNKYVPGRLDPLLFLVRLLELMK